MTFVKTTGSTDSFVGNNTVNRAVPHGLKPAPKGILLSRADSGNLHLIIGSRFTHVNDTSNYLATVTAIDATNFYVGVAADYARSGNGSGLTYLWAAVI